MNSVIITGASGLLGQYLCRYLAPRHKVIGFYNTTSPEQTNLIEYIQIDLTQTSIVKNLIQKINPQFIIHTAGYTSVDECELNPKIAFLQNVTCTKNICEAIEELSTKIVLISTDHLFSGESSNYSENAIAAPLNTYALTKLQSEEEINKIKNSVIIRTNFYGSHTDKKLSFSSWIYNELKQGKKINMFDDVFFTPISISSLAVNIELIMQSSLSGIYNIAGAERLSKYSFAIKLADIFGFPNNLINKSSVENFPLKAKRPKDMSLSIQKVSNELKKFQPENVNDGLNTIKRLNLI